MFKLVGKKCPGFSHASTLVTSWVLCRQLVQRDSMSISGKGGHHPTLQDFFQVGASGWTFGTGADKQDILLIPSAKDFGPGWYTSMLQTISVVVLEKSCSGDWVVETSAVWSWVLEQSSILISELNPIEIEEVKWLSCVTDIHMKIMQPTQISSVLDSTSHHEQALKQVNVSTSVSQPYYKKFNFFEYFKLHPF